MGQENCVKRPKAQNSFVYNVSVFNDVYLEPFQEYLVLCTLDSDVNINRVGIFLPFQEKLSTKGIVAAEALVSPTENKIPVRMINATAEKLKLFSKTKVGSIENYSTSNHRKIRQVSIKEENKSGMFKILERKINENCGLSQTEKLTLINLLKKYSSVFSTTKDDIGYCPYIEHEILTEPKPPIHDKIRRVPLGLEDKVDSTVKDLLTKGIIRQSDSPWNAALVVVRKKDGNIRLCVDYRNLNAITYRPIFPIPETKHLLDNLSGSKYFTSMDLSSAYYQVGMSEKDKEKTAFATRMGHFEFNRMPFGLCGAPATF